ncbi:MAG: M1 family metallopeptidase [Gemmatimonadetes bacterium]|nr:M1 family metallopeptidase [Gemmatimonadota bacterium]
MRVALLGGASFRRPALVVLVGLVGSTPVVGQEVGVGYGVTDRYERRAGVDVLHYEIGIELPAEGRMVRGRTGILYEATSEEGISDLALDFGPMTVDSVRVDGVPIPFAHDADGRLRLKTPGTEPGARSEAVVWYHGEPVDGLIFGETAAGARTVFADNWADRAHLWFPSIDHPSDKATVEFDVVVPASWRVVANGVLLERTDLDGGRARSRWAESAEIPTYSMVIGATEFTVTPLGEAGGVDLAAWSYPADSAAAAAMFSRTAEIVAFYDSLFGPFPYDKLAQIQSATKFGGMENASAIFYSAGSVATALDDPERRTGNASVVPHEIVHQWFGDAVTEADWNHLWLSEGFATYFAAVFFEFHGGPEGRGAEELARRMRAMRTAVLDFQRTAPEAAIHDPGLGPGEYEALLTDLNYEKGAWVLHMLRDLVGDPAFFETIRDYYATFRDGVAWTADFERVVEEASGEDLGWFFEQWIGRAGHPRIEIDVVPAGEDGRRWRVGLRQVQSGEPFRFPVDLRLEWDGGSRMERIWLEERGASWTFETPAPVVDVAIDPHARLLWEPADDGPP